MTVKAIFVDPLETLVRRDPVAGWDPKGWYWFLGAPEAIQALTKAGYRIVMMLDVEGAEQVEVDEWLAAIYADLFYHTGQRLMDNREVTLCRHRPEGLCDCRLRAVAELVEIYSHGDLERRNSWVVSSLDSDLKLARMFGFAQAKIMRGVPAPTATHRTFRSFRTFAQSVTGVTLTSLKRAPNMVTS